MSGKAMSLKAKLNNYAIKHHIAPQVVMQNYMFERFFCGYPNHLTEINLYSKAVC